MIIKDLPNDSKPREKALKFGVQNLSNDELIAILLRTGVKGMSSKEVAINIIKELDNFKNADNISIKRLSKIKGVGITKAITILSAIEFGKRISFLNPNKLEILNRADLIYEKFKMHFINIKQEEFIVVLLDNKKKLIDYKCIFKGNLNSVNVHPREIFKYALVNSAASIILLHNHPSGDVVPSKQDILITRDINEIGKILQISVIDHIIIGNNNYYSFFDNGVIF